MHPRSRCRSSRSHTRASLLGTFLARLPLGSPSPLPLPVAVDASAAMALDASAAMALDASAAARERVLRGFGWPTDSPRS